MPSGVLIREILNQKNLALLFGVASLVIVALGILTRRLEFRLGFYRALLVLTALPWYVHFRVTKTHCAGWGCDDPAVVPASGLTLFTYASPAVILVLLLFFIAIARRSSRSAVLFPIVAAIAQLFLTLLLRWRAPPDYAYMNAAGDRWLIASSLSAALCLTSYSLFSRVPPPKEILE